MKTFKVLFLIFAIAVFAGAGCNTNSKANQWSSEQKDKWTEDCMKFMHEQGVEKKDAEGFCDCMLKQTSEKYTPKEAVNITEDEERKMWQECDYVW